MVDGVKFANQYDFEQLMCSNALGFSYDQAASFAQQYSVSYNRGGQFSRINISMLEDDIKKLDNRGNQGMSSMINSHLVDKQFGYKILEEVYK